MWRIRVEYTDGGQLTITGKHKEIPLDLARGYLKEFRGKKVTYQQYPKKHYPEMDLVKKITELEQDI